jgi:PAS domain S-box-containing protein
LYIILLYLDNWIGMREYKNNVKYLIGILMGFAITLAISLFLIEYIFFEHSAQEVALDNGIKKTKEREGVFKNFLDDAKRELNAVNENSYFQEYLNSGKNKKIVEDILITYAKANKDIMQIRYIDKDGYEKIRVDRDKTKPTAYLVPQDRLQNKANRYYFSDSKAKELGKVWFSALDLNIERGKVEIPYRPTLRAVLPLSNSDKFGGIVIINYMMSEFLAKFIKAPLYDMVVYDNSGYILYHYEPTKCWSYYQENRHTLQKYYPNEYKNIVSNNLYKTDSFVTRKLDVDIQNGLNILLKLNGKYAKEQDEKSINQYLTVASIILLLALILIYIVVRFFSNTLLNLNNIKKLNSELKNQKNTNKIALEGSHIGVWEWDYATDKLLFDEIMYDIYGIESEDIDSYSTWRDIVEPQELQKVEENLKIAREKNEAYDISFWITKPNGQKRYIKAYGKNVYDGDGVAYKMVGTNQDITHLKLAQQKYKNILEFASDGIHIIDKYGNIVEYSDSFANNLGYNYEDVKKLNVADWDDKLKKDEIPHIIQDIIDTPTIFETKHKRADGSVIDVQINAKGIYIDDEFYLYASSRDITKQKALEYEIIKERDFISTMIDNANAVICVISADGTMTRLNRYGEEFTGYSQDEVSSKPYFWDRFLNDSIKDKVVDIIAEANKGNIVSSYQNSWKNRDGIEKMFEWSNSMVKKDDGSLDYIFTIGLDIDDKIKMQEEIAKTEKKFYTIFNESLDAIMLLDLKSRRFIDANETACSMYGYTKEEFLEIGITDMEVLEDEETIKRKQQIMQDNGYIKFDTKHYTKEGKVLDVTVLATTIKIDDEEFIFATFRDITKLKENEESLQKTLNQLSQAQKIAKLGVWEYDMVADKLEWSDEIYNIFELDKDSYNPTYQSFLEIIAPQDREKVNSAYQNAIKEKKPYNVSHQVVLASGKIKYVQEQSDIEYDKNGNPIKAIGTVYDITHIEELSQKINTERQRYKKLMELSAEGIFIMSAKDGSLIEYSQEVCRLLGYSQEELKNINILDWDKDIKSPQEYKEIISHIGSEPITIERTHTRKDGTTYTAGMQVVKIELNGEELLYASVRDISYLKDMAKVIEEQKELYETLFYKSPDAYFIMDINSGTIKDCNIAGQEILRGSKDEIVGLRADEVSPMYQPDGSLSIDSVAQKISGAIEYGKIRFEWVHKRLDGEEFWAEVTAGVVRIYGEDSIFVTWRDISENKLLEEGILKVKDEAVKANRAKSQFLANMSHEIRTPLNGIIGLTELVLDTKLSPIQKDYLSKSKQSSLALLNVINDILDYSKIEAGKLDIVDSEFRVNELLKNISGLFGYKIYQKGLDFAYNIDKNVPDILIGDALRITQIINNLLGNSVKFTQNGYIVLAIDMIDRDESDIKLKFSIKDSGIGINEEKKKKLFRAFEQGDNSTTKEYGGTGLGLMISKQLVELMGGEIWFDSRVDEGSEFSFVLSLGYISRIKSRDLDLSHLAQSKFIIVEDNELERQYLRKILESWKIDVSEASDGDEAYSMLDKNHYDYMLLDWKMPKVDGVELLLKLKEKSISIPKIVMVTAYEKKELISSAKEKDVEIEKVLEKPYTPSTLYNAISDNSISTIEDIVDINRELKLKETKKVLIVEDNTTNQIVATKMLQKVGFDTVIANNGQEAVDMCKDSIFDIIFMDLQMPVLDGFDATKEIRDMGITTPIIALSAAVMQKDKELTKEAGMDNHIAKPINKSELYEIIKSYFDTDEIDVVDSSSDNLIKIDGIDIQKLYSAMDNDEKEVYNLLSNFKSSYKEKVDYLSSVDLDSIEAKEYIHKLKGVSGNLKIYNIYENCKTLESINSIEDKIEVKNRLEKDLKDIIKRLEESLPKVESSEVSKESFEQIFDTLIDDLENYKFVHSDVIESVQSYLSDKTDKDTSKIKELFENHEFDELIELLLLLKTEI